MGAPAAADLTALGTVNTTADQKHRAALYVRLLAMLGLGVAS